MIVCRSCGSHNADTDDFCGSCGNFLEWTGEKLAPQPPTPEPQPPAPQPQRDVVAEPQAAAPQPQPAATPEPRAAETESVPSASPPKPVEPKPAVAGFTPAVTAFAPNAKPAAPEPAQRAVQALVAPPLPPAPGPTPPTRPTSDPVAGPDSGARKPQPQEMRPQAPVRRRPTAPTAVSPPTRQLQPDDLICGACGEGNPPIRRFCSRCGASLQTATVVPTPWWRKILRFLQQRRVHPVGTRPRRRPRLLTLRGVSAALRRVLLLALVLAGLSYAVFPSMRGAVNELVREGVDRIESSFGQDPVTVRPIRTTASAALPDHVAELATDQFTNTFWAAPDAQAQLRLVVEFERPTRLVRAVVFNGASGEEFETLGRPRDLHLVYSNDDRIIGESDASLEDIPGEQQIELGDGDGATRVEIQVLSVYSSPQSPGVALSYIEFFERQ